MAREVVPRKRRRPKATTSASEAEASTAAATQEAEAGPSTASNDKAETAVGSQGTEEAKSTEDAENEGKDEGGSSQVATASTPAKRQRAASKTGQPPSRPALPSSQGPSEDHRETALAFRTPVRTPHNRFTDRPSLLSAALDQVPQSPQSPGMRAFKAIVSLISPFSVARRSAAFGYEEDDNTAQGNGRSNALAKGKQRAIASDQADVEEEVEEEEDVANQLYPALPSQPIEAEEAIAIGAQRGGATNDVELIERTIEAIEEDDGEEEEEDEEEGGADVSMSEPDTREHAQSHETDDQQRDQEDRKEATPAQAFTTPNGKVPSSPALFDTPMDQAGETGMPVSPDVPAQRIAQGRHQPTSPAPIKASQAAPSPKPGQPSAVPYMQFTPSRPALPATVSSPAFTFGQQNNYVSPQLPRYPRPTKTYKSGSPLAKNYELLARFFAEKAEQEAQAEASTSVLSVDEDGNAAGGALTEVEMAGCLRLIEESYARGHGAEMERIRQAALDATAFPSVEEGDLSMHNLDEEEALFAQSRMPFVGEANRSRSPSLPLGAAAGDMPMDDRRSRLSRPSSSFLAPTHQQNLADARVNRSLAATFAPIATSPTAQKRKHRPLYLGPGVGASATSSLLRKTQQSTTTRRTILNNQRAAQQAQLKAVTMQTEGEEGGPRKRRKLPDTEMSKVQSTSAPAVVQSRPTPATVTPAPVPPPAVRTAAADAMLSILKAGPALPERSPIKRAAEAVITTDPGIVNPYQTGTSMATRKNGSNATSAAATAAAKEKERLKEEREKRQRALKEREARKESTLDFIKRTAPVPVRRSGRAIRLEEEDEEDGEEEAEAAAERPSSSPMEEQEAKRKADEERKRKNEELKRRTELLTKKTQANGSPTSSGTPNTTSRTESKDSTVGVPASRSFNFSAFTPKKPSPLSQPTSNVGADSPSTSSEASEATSRTPIAGAIKPPVSAAAASQAETIVLDDSDEEETPAPAPSSKPMTSTFSFGSKPATSGAPAASSSATPAFTFGSSSATITASKTPTSLSGPAPSASQTPFTFQPAPVEQSKAAESTSTPASTATSAKSARMLALEMPLTDLPAFQFDVEVIHPTSSQATLSSEARSAKEAALVADVIALPTFDFGTSTASLTDSATLTAPVETTPVVKPFSFSSTNSSTNSAPFAFKSSTPTAMPASAPQAPAASTAPTAVSNGASNSSPSTDNNGSALLAGTGEGEEDESTLHEVRCKVWNLAGGQWNDLGIGSLKIKQHRDTHKRRVLVRNEGNGKVTVNFNILSSFKPNQDKNVISFLGFDATGKPMSYRCKIKTEGSATELKQALEESAKAASA